MPALLFFIVFFIAILFAGALFSYPFHVIINLFTQREFHESIMDTTQICGLIFSLVYLYLTDTLTLDKTGLKWQPRSSSAGLITGFIGGFAIIFVLISSLLALGVYGFQTDRHITSLIIIKLLTGALITGFAVSLFEETVFRGALFSGLSKQTNATIALITISLVYAAVHFIDYREPAVTDTINWMTAVKLFVPAYLNLISLETIDAFAALFMLGILLGLVRIRNGDIIQCIGLHTGLVAGIKIARFFTGYSPGNNYDFLVSSYDHRLGYLTLLWLLFASLAYYFITKRNRVSPA